MWQASAVLLVVSVSVLGCSANLSNEEAGDENAIIAYELAYEGIHQVLKLRQVNDSTYNFKLGVESDLCSTFCEGTLRSKRIASQSNEPLIEFTAEANGVWLSSVLFARNNKCIWLKTKEVKVMDECAPLFSQVMCQP